MHIFLNWNIYVHPFIETYFSHLKRFEKQTKTSKCIACGVKWYKSKCKCICEINWIFCSLHLKVLNHFPICICRCSWRRAMCMCMWLGNGDVLLCIMLVMTPYVLDQHQPCQQSSSQLLLSTIFVFFLHFFTTHFQNILLITYVKCDFVCRSNTQLQVLLCFDATCDALAHAHLMVYRIASLTFIFTWMQRGSRDGKWSKRYLVGYKCPIKCLKPHTAFTMGRIFACKRIRIGSPLCIQTQTHKHTNPPTRWRWLPQPYTTCMDGEGLYLPRPYYQRVYFHLHLHFFPQLHLLLLSLV